MKNRLNTYVDQFSALVAEIETSTSVGLLELKAKLEKKQKKLLAQKKNSVAENKYNVSLDNDVFQTSKAYIEILQAKV